VPHLDESFQINSYHAHHIIMLYVTVSEFSGIYTSFIYRHFTHLAIMPSRIKVVFVWYIVLINFQTIKSLLCKEDTYSDSFGTKCLLCPAGSRSPPGSLSFDDCECDYDKKMDQPYFVLQHHAGIRCCQLVWHEWDWSVYTIDLQAAVISK